MMEGERQVLVVVVMMVIRNDSGEETIDGRGEKSFSSGGGDGGERGGWQVEHRYVQRGSTLTLPAQ